MMTATAKTAWRLSMAPLMTPRIASKLEASLKSRKTWLGLGLGVEEGVGVGLGVGVGVGVGAGVG